MKATTTVRPSIYNLFYETFGDDFKVDAKLSRYTSARVGGPAEMFLTVYSAAELQQAVELAYDKKVPYFILGGGSNIPKIGKFPKKQPLNCHHQNSFVTNPKT